MAAPLIPNASSVGVVDRFSGNFTKALYLRGKSAAELVRVLGYGPGRLDKGWWLIFALEKPTPNNFEFGGYTHFSGARIGHPDLGNARPRVEDDLAGRVGGAAGVLAQKVKHITGLQLVGPERLAKVIPAASGNDYPVGAGIYQCNVPQAIRCKVAAFVAAGGQYLGNYT